MRTLPKTLIALLTLPTAAHAAYADDTRELGAHVHGEGRLDIAVDGTTVALSLVVPGADVVGFEHAAETAEEQVAVETTLATLERPLELFVMPEAAGCAVTSAEVALVAEEAEGDGHDHDHDHDHGHDHDKEAAHNEVQAEYLLTCAAPEALNRIDFAWFEAFPNSERLDVQMVGTGGAQAAEVRRDAPALDLGGLF
ncbi:MAG: DUF2796 domain-containing protein [Rhodobacteraceae bacterium]|jgi:hypothetical protein|nr:DUF2796 domain-containing protein [Paracoccaceae bacterium]